MTRGNFIIVTLLGLNPVVVEWISPVANVMMMTGARTVRYFKKEYPGHQRLSKCEEMWGLCLQIFTILRGMKDFCYEGLTLSQSQGRIVPISPWW